MVFLFGTMKFEAALEFSVILLVSSSALKLVTGENVTSELNNAADTSNSSESSDEAGKVETDERIGLTVNRGQAHAFGPGGLAVANSLTYGLQAGVLNLHANSYRPIYNRFGGYANQFRTGPHAPNAWSGSQSYGNRGYLGGKGYAGYNNGVGQANVFSRTQTQRIPIGPGMVLLSGLKDPSNATVEEGVYTNQTNSEQPPISDQSDKLVFTTNNND